MFNKSLHSVWFSVLFEVEWEMLISWFILLLYYLPSEKKNDLAFSNKDFKFLLSAIKLLKVFFVLVIKLKAKQ